MLNIYTPDITHLPLLLIKVYRYSNAKPVSLCLGNYSDTSSHTLSMTCIGNHFFKQTHSIQIWKKKKKTARDSFEQNTETVACLLWVPKSRGPDHYKWHPFKREVVLCLHLWTHTAHLPRPRPALGCQQLPPGPHSPLERNREGCEQVGTASFPQKFQQGTETWKLCSLPKYWQLRICFLSSHVVTHVPSLSCGTCS